MSRQNVEMARRWCEAMTAGPEETQAAIAEMADPDLDFYPVRKFPEAQPCHGREEFSQFMARFQNSYSSTEWPVKKMIEVGDDRVVAWANLQTEGRGSGVRLEGDVYICFWIRNGRFFRIENHVTERGAVVALGLEGETFEDAAGPSTR